MRILYQLYAKITFFPLLGFSILIFFTLDEASAETYYNENLLFTFEYPDSWIVDESDQKNGVIVSFYDKVPWQSRITINFFEKYGNVASDQYFQLMKNVQESVCDDLTFEEHGQICYDFKITSEYALKIDGIQAYEIITSYKNQYPDNPTVFETISTLTEIPIGDTFWQIKTENNPSIVTDEFASKLWEHVRSIRFLDEPILFTESIKPGSNKNSFNVYLHDIPEWVTIDVDSAFDAAAQYWNNRDGTKLNRVYDESTANISVRWVKDYGGELLGVTIGNNFVEVGFGDDKCNGYWQPYSQKFFTDTLAHELGHAIGYDHINDPDDIMNPNAPIYYQIESYKWNTIPGYAHFVPICSQDDVSQYNYEVRDESGDHIVNAYFVSSYLEYEKFVSGQPFSPYSGCFQENKLIVKGTCNVKSGSGVIVEAVDGQSNSLANISFNFEQENQGVVYVDSDLQKSPPKVMPTSESPGLDSKWLTLEQETYYSIRGQPITVNLIGNIPKSFEESGYLVNLAIIKPDGIVEELSVPTKTNGDFNTPWIIESGSQSGVYQVSGKYKNIDLPPIFFNVIDSYQSTINSQASKLDDSTKLYQNSDYGFSINYPSTWSFSENYEMVTGETGILSITDDKELWNGQINVNYYVDELKDYQYTEEQYLTDLIQLHKDDCTADQASLDNYGSYCSNFKLLNSEAKIINGLKSYEIVYSYKETFQDGSFYDNTVIITEIPLGDDLWQIFSEVISDYYVDYKPLMEKTISSFRLNEASAEIYSPPHETSSTLESPSSTEPKFEENKLAPFVDPSKEPIYYIDRYYNEPLYKEWFDRNYPEYTIEEAVGFSSTVPTSWYQRGLELFNAESYGMAIQYFDKALLIDPAHSPSKEKKQQAEEYLEYRAFADPKDVLPENNFGYYFLGVFILVGISVIILVIVFTKKTRKNLRRKIDSKPKNSEYSSAKTLDDFFTDEKPKSTREVYCKDSNKKTGIRKIERENEILITHICDEHKEHPAFQGEDITLEEIEELSNKSFESNNQTLPEDLALTEKIRKKGLKQLIMGIIAMIIPAVIFIVSSNATGGYAAFYGLFLVGMYMTAKGLVTLKQSKIRKNRKKTQSVEYNLD